MGRNMNKIKKRNIRVSATITAAIFCLLYLFHIYTIAFADGHVKEMNFDNTVGDKTEAQNMHFVKEYLDNYIP
jgi:hypothetical protein